MLTIRRPGRDCPLCAEYPLRHQDPVRSLPPLVGEQLSRSQDASVGVVVDALDAECHTMYADQVLTGYWLHGKHSDLGIVHAFIVYNLNGTLDDVDVIVLYPSDES